MKNETRVAKCSRMIKQELQEKFPNILFSVNSERFGFGDAVHVFAYIENVEDFVIEEDIRKYTKKYVYGSFDGMTDHYEVSNLIKDLPQTKYVDVVVEYSPEVSKKMEEDFNKYWNGKYIISSREAESYHFKGRKVGICEYTSPYGDFDPYEWYCGYVKEHYSR